MPPAGRKPKVSDTQLLRAIALHPDPVVTASDISEAVGMTNQGVNNRLPDLVDQGYVNRKQVGARAVIYWLSDAGREEARSSS